MSTPRAIKVFKEYKDFNDKSVEKSKLAALAVCTKIIIETNEKAVGAIQDYSTRLCKRIGCFWKTGMEASDAKIIKLEEHINDLTRNLAENENYLEGIKSEILNLKSLNKNLEEQLEQAKRSPLINMINTSQQFENNKEEQIMLTPDWRSSSKFLTTKLDYNTPKFNGKKDEDIDAWFFKVEISLKIAKYHTNEWLERMANYVLGDGGDIIKASIMNHGMTLKPK